MAESETGQEKTEPATARKRQKAREDGNVPKSQEINTVVLLIAGVAAFYFFCDNFYGQIMSAIEFYLENCATRMVNDQEVHPIFIELYLRVIKILWPFFLTFVIVALIANFSQVGFLISGKSIQPKFEKINPAKGIKRIFSARGAMELTKSIGKIFLIAPVMMFSVYGSIDDFKGLITVGVGDSMIFMGYEALEMAIKAILIMLVLAIIDYTYQRWQHEKDLRMTKEEVKQEMKDVQGDPQVKSRIRSIQREMARQRMMKEVPEAEVVVTNPTEYAIALKYDPDEQPAPIVVAKGRHLLAQRIKEIAIEHDVPIVENRPLAQSLYKLAEVGGLVPPELYQAVAEVLAYVYKLNNKAYQRA